MSYSEKIEMELTWRDSIVWLDQSVVCYSDGPPAWFAARYPEHVDAAKRVYDANRALKENETRGYSPWVIGTMSIDGDRLVIMWSDGKTWLVKTRDELARFHKNNPERLAYFDAHYVKPLGKDEIEHNGERLRFTRATLDQGADTLPQYRAQVTCSSDGWFSPFFTGTALSPENVKKARAWWRANVTLPEGYEFDEAYGARKVEAKELGKDEIEHRGKRLKFERAEWTEWDSARVYTGDLFFIPFDSGTEISPSNAEKARAWWKANVKLPEGYEFDDEKGAKRVMRGTVYRFDGMTHRVVRDEPESELERLRDLGEAATREALDRLMEERDDAQAEVKRLQGGVPMKIGNEIWERVDCGEFVALDGRKLYHAVHNERWECYDRSDRGATGTTASEAVANFAIARRKTLVSELQRTLDKAEELRRELAEMS